MTMIMVLLRIGPSKYITVNLWTAGVRGRRCPPPFTSEQQIADYERGSRASTWREIGSTGDRGPLDCRAPPPVGTFLATGKPPFLAPPVPLAKWTAPSFEGLRTTTYYRTGASGLLSSDRYAWNRKAPGLEAHSIGRSTGQLFLEPSKFPLPVLDRQINGT